MQMMQMVDCCFEPALAVVKPSTVNEELWNGFDRRPKARYWERTVRVSMHLAYVT
jgi:hypothetical protein